MTSIKEDDDAIFLIGVKMIKYPDNTRIMGTRYTFCPDCYKKYNEARYKILRSKNLYKQAPESVRYYTIYYQGRKPKHTDKYEISSDWFRNKYDAIEQLKIMAIFLECKNVIDVRFNKETEDEPSESGKGTHYYTVWSANGYAVK